MEFQMVERSVDLTVVRWAYLKVDLMVAPKADPMEPLTVDPTADPMAAS